MALLPIIQKEVADKDAYEEHIQEKNMTKQDISEITELLQKNNNDRDRFLQLLSIYNIENYSSEIMVLIFNIILVPAHEQELLLSVFMKKTETALADFTNITNTQPQTLEECLSQRFIPYDDILLLTQIDFVSISEADWNFLKILPVIYIYDAEWVRSFSDFVIAYLGDRAYTKIQDIIDILL